MGSKKDAVSIIMHITHVIPNEQGGGAESLVRMLHEGLTDDGYSSERVHFCGERSFSETVSRFGRKHDSLLNVFELRAHLKRQIHRFGSNIILHSHLTHGFYFSLAAMRGLPILWVHTEHNTEMRLRRVKCLRPVERHFYNRCDRVVAISSGVERSLSRNLRLNPSKVETVVNGVPGYAPMERSRVGGGVIRIVSVGSLNRRKGFDVALTALASASIGRWNYTIVGQGPELESLKKLVCELGVEDNVIFAGWADPSPYFRSADLQIIPSRYEGFGLVAVEGMSTGLRVLGSDVDGLREVIGSDSSAGRLVRDHCSALSWKIEIEGIVKQLRPLSSTTSQASIAQARKFSFDRMLSGYATIYDDLAKSWSS